MVFDDPNDSIENWNYKDGDMGDVDYEVDEADEMWFYYDTSRDVASEEAEFIEYRDSALKTFFDVTVMDPLGETFHFDNGFSIDIRVDVINAFGLIWDTFRNNTATELARHFSGQFANITKLGSFGSTDNTLNGLQHITKIDFERIYQTMDEKLQDSLGGKYHGENMPEIDERDSHQRVVFISSVMFHEFLHIFQGSSAGLKPAVKARMEAACWAAQYWYTVHVGGHAWLKAHTYNLVTDGARRNENGQLMASGKSGIYSVGLPFFESFLYALADRSPRLTNCQILKRLFSA